MKSFNQPKSDIPSSLAGLLLVAHPELKDPNFAHTVVLISSHSLAEGAIGVIINRPLEYTLDKLEDFVIPPYMNKIQIYDGGPVEISTLLFTGWEWLEKNRFLQLYFGLSVEEIGDMMKRNKKLTVKGFFGHAAWQPGQIEAEIQRGIWVTVQMKREIMDVCNDQELWKKILIDNTPELRVYLNVPDDPSMN